MSTLGDFTDREDTDERAIIASEAIVLWSQFSTNERTLVRFGMFPAGKMRAAETDLRGRVACPREVARLLAVALMDCAKADGGMRA